MVVALFVLSLAGPYVFQITKLEQNFWNVTQELNIHGSDRERGVNQNLKEEQQCHNAKRMIGCTTIGWNWGKFCKDSPGLGCIPLTVLSCWIWNLGRFGLYPTDRFIMLELEFRQAWVVSTDRFIVLNLESQQDQILSDWPLYVCIFQLTAE